MRLYYSPGRESLSPHIALREAGRPFELVRVELRAQLTSDGAEFSEINPKGYVPVLDIDGERLTEGLAIVQYIADLVPERRLAPPPTTFARYRLQEWLGFIATELQQPFHPLFEPDTPAAMQERLRVSIAERLGYTARELRSRAFVMGDTFTVADGYLYTVLRWCKRFELNLDGWPGLAGYFDRIAARPFVQAALAAEGLLETRRAPRDRSVA
jgi:glutathione S-transferase